MTDSSATHSRIVRLALRLGVVMLASGAQTRDVETSVRTVMRTLGLPAAAAVITYSTVSVSSAATRDADVTTAIQAVRRWEPDYDRLAAAATLASAIGAGRADLEAAEARLEELTAGTYPYPRWLRFSAPALLSMAVTVMFGGSVGDALATLGIGIAIQPALERIERSDLSEFFRFVFGVSATAMLVVLLVKAGLPIQGSLVLTGSLLRFLPGAGLVSGMHDLIDGALLSGAARLAGVLLLGAAIAGAATLVLTVGAAWDVHLQISSAGRVDWPAAVLVVAGAAAVLFYACHLGVPRRALIAGAALGAVAVVLARGLSPASEALTPAARTLTAALVIGIAGRLLAHRSEAPAALWMVPAILPLLPAPSTLLPLLAETDAARQALQYQAAQTAFGIGVGVASGSILVEAYLRYHATLSGRLSARVPPLRGWSGRWRPSSRSGSASATEPEEGMP